MDTKHGLISGVPQKQDLGAHSFTVIAQGRTHGLTATDTFTVEVNEFMPLLVHMSGIIVRFEYKY